MQGRLKAGGGGANGTLPSHAATAPASAGAAQHATAERRTARPGPAAASPACLGGPRPLLDAVQQPLERRLSCRSEPHIQQRRLCPVSQRRRLRIRLLLRLRRRPARRACRRAALPHRRLYCCGGGPQHLLHLGAHSRERPGLQLPKLHGIAGRVRILRLEGATGREGGVGRRRARGGLGLPAHPASRPVKVRPAQHHGTHHAARKMPMAAAPTCGLAATYAMQSSSRLSSGRKSAESTALAPVWN